MPTQGDVFYARLSELYAAGDLDAVERYLRAECEREARSGIGGVPALNQLACHLRNVGRLAESGPVFEEALARLEEAGMRQTPQYAIVLLNRAGLDRLMGDLNQAIEGFEESSRLLANAGAAYAYERASVLNNLSLVYMEGGDAARSITMARAALRMLDELGGHGAEVATTRSNLSTMLLAAGDAEGARAEAQAAIAWYEEANDLGVHYGSACAALGSALYALHDEHAVTWLNRAREALLAAIGKTLDYARVCANLAMAKRSQGDVEEATALEQEAAWVEQACRGGDAHGSAGKDTNVLRAG